MHSLLPLVAVFQWDPQVRGILIVILAVTVLPGSVYLLLATNMGARLGAVLAVAGLSGWVMLMAVVWAVFGIGIQGRVATWKPLEITSGPPSASALNVGRGLTSDPLNPIGLRNGWKSLVAGDPVYGDSVASGDKILAPNTTKSATGEAPAPPKFTPPFSASTDYVYVAGFQKNSKEDATWFSIQHHRFYKNGPAWNPIGWFRHEPHYVVLVVQKAYKDPLATSTSKPVADKTQPYTSLLLVRDLGSLRFPPVMVALASGLIFAVCCYWLHKRDQEVWAADEAGSVAPATA